MSAPETKTLFSDSRYSFEGIASNVNNQMLTPAAYSQIETNIASTHPELAQGEI